MIIVAHQFAHKPKTQSKSKMEISVLSGVAYKEATQIPVTRHTTLHM